MMAMPDYLQRFKKGFVSAVSSVGYTALPVTLALPFLAFVYLKATKPSPDLSESPAAALGRGWAGLPADYTSFQWFAIFSSVLFLGALGSTVSFFARHDLKEHQLKRSRTLVGTQLLGAVFASILLFAFIGGLVQGSLFPKIEAHSWIALSFRVPDWSKLLVWSFIAGFSERFVPDLLDNLILRGGKDGEHADRVKGSGDA